MYAYSSLQSFHLWLNVVAIALSVAQWLCPFCCFSALHASASLQSFHLWLNVVAIALSVSGARKYLDADSPHALPALGWLDGVLGWFSSACIPVLLFANGVWMVGKDITGGKRGQIQVG
jgi:hypothetical protein